RHRRQVLPRERHAGRHRRREQVRQRDDDLVGIALRALHVEEAFGAGAAGLVDDDHRLLHQVVLGDDALQEARHLVGAASGAGRDDERDRLGGLPREGGRRQRGTQRERRRKRDGTAKHGTVHDSSYGCIDRPRAHGTRVVASLANMRDGRMRRNRYFTRPAPRAHWYFAPSTITGVSVVYGYAGIPWSNRNSAASSTCTSPASDTTTGLWIPLARISSTTSTISLAKTIGGVTIVCQ